MNRTVGKWLMAVSLALNAGMLAAVAVNAARQASPPAGNSQPVSLPEHLGLSEDQRREWTRLERDFLKELSSNWQEIRAHREALIRQVFSPAPDRAAIDREQAAIAALQDAQQRRVIAQLLAERELLDARQRAALMNLLLSRYAQESTEEEMLHRH